MVVATPVYIYDNSRNDKAIQKYERKKGRKFDVHQP